MQIACHWANFSLGMPTRISALRSYVNQHALACPANHIMKQIFAGRRGFLVRRSTAGCASAIVARSLTKSCDRVGWEATIICGLKRKGVI
jgi:hypothetical protein